MEIDFHNCLVPYDAHGVQFSYPDIWELTEQTEDGDVMITVASEGTTFWTLRLLPGCPPPPQAVNSCVKAFEDEYDEVEVQTVDCRLAEMPAYARDLEFFCLELMNTVGLRSVRTSDFTLLVWWQGTAHELEECRPLLNHLTDSVRATALLD